MIVLVCAALAADASDPRLGVELAALAARVEAEAGRRFDRLPDVREATAAEVQSELLETRSALTYLHRLPRTREGAEGVLDPRELALYQPARDTIWILRDRVDLALVQFRVAPEDAASVRRCLVAHELTHALQTRFVELPPARDSATLIEGQASLVAARVCRAAEPPSGWRSFQAFVGLLGVLDYRVDDHQRAYREGLLYVAALEAEKGREAVWTALSAPPPSPEAVDALVTRWTGAPWRHGLLAADWLSSLRHADPPEGVEADWDRLEVPAPAAQQVGVYGCQAASTTRGLLTVELLWCRADTGTSWSAWAEGWLPLVELAARDGARLEVMPSSDVLLRIVNDPSRLEIEWRGRADTVVSISQWGPKGARLKPGERDALFSVALGASGGPLDGLEGLLRGDTPPPPPPLGPVTPSYVAIPAVMAWVDGEPERCADRLEALGVAAGLEALWLRCAVDAGDLARSDRAWAAVPPEKRSPDATSAYVGLLENGRRWADARAVIETMDIQTTAGRKARATLRVELDIQRSDVEALRVDVWDPELGDDSRVAASVLLVVYHHADEAHALVDELCARPQHPSKCEALPRLQGW